MDTVLYELNDYKRTGVLSDADREKLKAAARILRDGGLVAFPTETVYGLGGNALLKDAALRIYKAKGRPSDNPLIVHITDFDEIGPLVKEFSESARRLSKAFWPGPFTLILPKSAALPRETTGGLDTVALRMPSDPVARELIRLSGVPIAAPSANASGRPSTTTAAHCVEDLWGRIEAIVDGGSCRIGVESTIVDVSGAEPMLLRPGAVTREMLTKILGAPIAVDPAVEKPLEHNVHPKAPGMKYRHYAPKAPMLIIEPKAGTDAEILNDRSKAVRAMAERLMELAKDKTALGIRTGIIVSDEVALEIAELLKEDSELGALEPKLEQEGELKVYEAQKLILMDLGSRRSEEVWAKNLFSALRLMDELSAEQIYAEGVDQHDIGFAIMNRLKKAAGGSELWLDA